MIGYVVIIGLEAEPFLQRSGVRSGDGVHHTQQTQHIGYDAELDQMSGWA